MGHVLKGMVVGHVIMDTEGPSSRHHQAHVMMDTDTVTVIARIKVVVLVVIISARKIRKDAQSCKRWVGAKSFS